MIFNVFVVYNKKINCYERPIVTYHEPDEFIEYVKRDFFASGNDAKEKLKENVIIHLGTYDDNTAKFELIEKNPLIDLGTLEVVKNDGVQ